MLWKKKNKNRLEILDDDLSLKDSDLSKLLWQGFFDYGGAGTKFDYSRVPIQFKVEQNDTSFSGESSDNLSKDFFVKPALVQGFIDGDHISFVIIYPNEFFMNDAGVFEVDYTSKDFRVTYDGGVDLSTGWCKGFWEILPFENEIEKYIAIKIKKGKWALKITLDH